MKPQSGFNIGRFLGVRAISILVAIGGCFLVDLLSKHLPGGDYTQRLVWLAGLYVTLAVSLNLINGITGQFSIGHAAFYMVGAYVGAFFTNSVFHGSFPDTQGSFSHVIAALVDVAAFVILVTLPFIRRVASVWVRIAIYCGMLVVAGLIGQGVLLILLRVPIPIPFGFLQSIQKYDILWLVLMAVAGAFGAAFAGLLVGLPSLRLRGDYLAIVTLGFGEIIRIIVYNTNEIGGSYGMNIDKKIPAVWIVWLLAVICIAVSRNLLKTAPGLLFLSVREDEIAASAMGVNVTKIKVTAFLLGSAFAGAAGALYAHSEGFITPATFGMDVSFIILTMVVLGGTGSITGSIIAAVVLSLLPEFLRLNNPRTGQAIILAGSSVVATLLAVIVVVTVVKRIIDAGKGTKLMRFGFYMAAIIGGFVCQFLFSMLFSKYQPLATKVIPLEQLRMVIFAVTLIVVMLLKPNGLLAHHEFSWSWVKKLFGIKAPETAVAA